MQQKSYLHSLQISEEEFEEVLKYPHKISVEIEGNLEVDGHISVDDMQSLLVHGNIHCQSFWIRDGKCQCKNLYVSQWALLDERCHELHFEKFVVPLLCTKYPKKLDFEYLVDLNVFAFEEQLFRWLLEDDFQTVYKALQSGEKIDDDWAVAQKNLLRSSSFRSYLNLE